jgi:DNA repair exonuclease SbcCD ATPase subunit
MGADHRVEFTFEEELKEKARSCRGCGHAYEDGKARKCPECGAERGMRVSDKLTVRVRDAGHLQSFDQDSGGGKALLAFAVRVALARFLGASVLFLDEVCAELDDENLKLLVETIHKLPEFGFRQVFVISHRREVAEAMPRNIVVTRDPEEGCSSYRLE